MAMVDVLCEVGEAAGDATCLAGVGEFIRLGECPKSLRGGGERRRALVGDCDRFVGGGGE